MVIKNISVYNMYPAIFGIRNSYKSKYKSDSSICLYEAITSNIFCFNHCNLGFEDRKLVSRLLRRHDEYGHQERKFLRQIFVSMNIRGSIKFWSQMDTFKIGTVRNSESTMHSLTDTLLEMDDFEKDISGDQIKFLNVLIDGYKNAKMNYKEDDRNEFLKKIFEVIDANLPCGYLLESHWSANYEVLRNIYHGRKNHKMYWWKEFIEQIEDIPYFDLMIKGEDDD